jgi:hypothetical protein
VPAAACRTLVNALARSSSGDVITVALDGLTVSNSRIAPPAGLGASGGGIHAQVLDSIIRLSLNEVTMMGNSAETGGALSFVSDYGDIVATITKSVFKNNTARGLGGAIRVAARGVPARLSIEDSRFENNRAGTGGAVSMRVVGNGRLDIARSIFASGHRWPRWA